MFESLEPATALGHFYEITKIPRGSGNEKALSDRIRGFAETLGLAAEQDGLHNLIVRKPAAPGYEGEPPVILQAHLDMVCEKLAGSAHCFESDALDVELDGDFIKARGTTLGADNGVAVAILMALMEGCGAHPAIEFVFTSGEETGMTGAQGLDVSSLVSRRMVNLDADSDDGFVMGCASGTSIMFKMPMSRKPPPEGAVLFEVSVTGLAGGHSGMDIHRNRAHSIRLLGAVVAELSSSVDMAIHSIGGGLKVNAIPRESFVTAYLPRGEVYAARRIVDSFFGAARAEFGRTDPNLKVAFGTPAAAAGCALDEQSMQRLLFALQFFPNGVKQTSDEIPGLVASSCNFGAIETRKDSICISAMSRAADKRLAAEIHEKIEELAKMTGAETVLADRSPPWPLKMDSPLLKKARLAYLRTYGKEPGVTAVHAGLECGIFADRLPGLDIVSFGPVIKDLHTPDERVSVSSINRVWRFAVELLGMKEADQN